MLLTCWREDDPVDFGEPPAKLRHLAHSQIRLAGDQRSLEDLAPIILGWLDLNSNPCRDVRIMGGLRFVATASPGQRGRSAVLPLWLVMLITSALPVRVFLFGQRRRRDLRRRRAGLCDRCGYDIRANTGRCSECGEPFGSHAPVARRDRWRPALACTNAAMLAALVIWLRPSTSRPNKPFLGDWLQGRFYLTWAPATGNRPDRMCRRDEWEPRPIRQSGRMELSSVSW
jgi:hypothetical protein